MMVVILTPVDGIIRWLPRGFSCSPLWEASDEGWRSRSNDSPVCTGAESFIAGTASCRIEVEGIDELYQHIKPLGILHPNTSLKDQWWDERDFAVIDPDNNLISFFQQIKS